ncbi:MAG: hypothetical protein K9G49_10300 [Taibaiella sp.]|nr:hypothetical protein [Taibaiella sp.]
MHFTVKTILNLFTIITPFMGICQESKPKYEGRCGRIVELAGLCEGHMKVSKLINGCSTRILTAKIVLITEDSLFNYTNKELIIYQLKAQDTVLLGCSGCKNASSKKICYEYKVLEETYK